MNTQPVLMKLNGISVNAVVEPRTLLGDFLRDDQRLTGLHLACEHGVCGACNVYVNGQLSRACTQLAIQCDHQEVRTIEGFDADELMGLLREAFSAGHALQCGYCTPGMLLAAHDIVRRFPLPDEATVRRELSGNLCRCTGYAGIVRAVMSVAHAHPGQATGATSAVAVSAPPIEANVVASAPLPVSEDSAEIPLPARLHDDGSATQISRQFQLSQPCDQVWAFFSNVAAVAACMPGLEVSQIQGERLRGVFSVKVGPIRAAFATVARIQRDDAQRSGRVESEGRDRITHSSTIARLDYRLSPQAGGATRVDIGAAFQIKGRLAEFSRPAIVAALAGELTERFAANVEARLGPDGESGANKQSRPLEIGLAHAVMVWLRRIFSRQ